MATPLAKIYCCKNLALNGSSDYQIHFEKAAYQAVHAMRQECMVFQM